MTDISTQLAQASWTVELIRGTFALLASVLVGGLVLLGGLATDRRRTKADADKSAQHENAVLHGAFTVSNFIKVRLNDWASDGRHSRLMRLKIAQSYVQRLIERAPSDSYRIMVALLDVGLRLDALLDWAEKLPSAPTLGALEEHAEVLKSCADELDSSLELLDVLLTGELPMMSDEDLDQLISS